MLRFIRICCEREPVIVTSVVIGSIGFLLPLISPGQYKEGTYLSRLEEQRAAYQPVEGATSGVSRHLRSWWGLSY